MNGFGYLRMRGLKKDDHKIPNNGYYDAHSYNLCICIIYELLLI